MPVAAVVLAAGAGSRFAGPVHKLRAELAGKPVISWVLEAVAHAGFDNVYVITGAEDLSDLVPATFSIIRADDWAEGQSRTLQAAVDRARDDGMDAIVVGLGDQPMVPPSAWRSVGASAGPIVIASFDGDRRPPVKLDASVWDLLPTKGDHGARVLLRDRPDLVSEIPCMGNAEDIDTAEDLHRWK